MYFKFNSSTFKDLCLFWSTFQALNSYVWNSSTCKKRGNPLCKVRELSGLIKNILICVPMTWRWVLNDRIFILRWTIPVRPKTRNHHTFSHSLNLTWDSPSGWWTHSKTSKNSQKLHYKAIENLMCIFFGFFVCLFCFVYWKLVPKLKSDL